MQCHSYIFFDREPSLRTVPKEKLKKYKAQFTAHTAKKGSVGVAAYATLGFRPESRFMLHLQAKEAQDIQTFLQELLHTELGVHLKITYTLLGLVRPSQYHPKQIQSEKEKKFIDGEKKYLVVYPFTKTTEWHLLPFEERRTMMGEHVMTARKFSGSIDQLLLYAYGIDDHEFIVSYQTDNLLDFQSLVMALRNTKGRAYTKNDTPIFTCTYMPLKDALEML